MDSTLLYSHVTPMSGSQSTSVGMRVTRKVYNEPCKFVCKFPDFGASTISFFYYSPNVRYVRCPINSMLRLAKTGNHDHSSILSKQTIMLSKEPFSS